GCHPWWSSSLHPLRNLAPYPCMSRMVVRPIVPKQRDRESRYFDRRLENRESIGTVVDESARYERDQVRTRDNLGHEQERGRRQRDPPSGSGGRQRQVDRGAETATPRRDDDMIFSR